MPEDTESSELVNRIDDDDPEWIMPPPESHKTLNDREKDLLRRWIAEGAAYADHWSFTPISRPETPRSPIESTQVSDSSLAPSPIEHPIDAFITKRLRTIGGDLSPSARADRLARRLSLDLVGLPPSADQVKRLTDASAANFDAVYQSLLDELLESPHHGERMASFWLDLVRYSDTVGYHGDQNQNIFPYRDWVVDAFNINMPFDEFTRKQLAGDLLPDATTDDLVASGFNRLNMVTREGGAQPEEYLTKYATDRVRTVGMAWMGLTTGCAECHDHKFDPFTAKDFYSLGAFFADLKQWGVYSDYGYTPNKDLKGFNNNFPFPPEIEVVSNALVRKQAGYRKQLVLASRSLLDSLPDKDRQHAEDWHGELIVWLSQFPSGWKRATQVEIPSDQNSAVTDKKTKRKPRRFTITPSSLGFGKQDGLLTKAIQLSFPAPMDGKERKLEVQFFIETSKPDKRRSVKVTDAVANRFLPSFSSTSLVDTVAKSWSFPSLDSSGDPIGIGEFRYFLDRSQSSGEPMRAVFEFERPIRLKNDERLTIEISGGEKLLIAIETSPLGRLRALDTTETEILATSQTLSDSAGVVAWALTHRRPDNNLRRLLADYRGCRDGRTPTMVAQAGEPITVRVLPRGNWQDHTGEVVQPAVPEFLRTKKDRKLNGKRLTRLDLAEWLVSPENPLTARVVANRLWKQFFGKGITEAADDFGAQGDPPSHPELLDYLASELIESNWNIRHVIRLIVNSRTYRQDSKRRVEFDESDPENRLLAFHPPRRLEAEAIRDNALAIAGLLNTEIGGPAVKPYQPTGYYSNLQFPNRTYVATGDRSQYRRGLYMHWQRTFLHPMLANFDAPSREDCVAIRANANTPQQALTLLNDPTFIEAAGQFAWNTLIDYSDANDETRVRAMIEKAVQREATSDEIVRLTDFLNQQRKVFVAEPKLIDELMSVGIAESLRDWERLGMNSADNDNHRVEWAAWTATARVLLNLHETITRF